MDAKIYQAVRIDQPRDFTIYGQIVSAYPGNYALTDADGNVQILDETTFRQQYADAGTGVAGQVSKIRASRRDNDKENELELVSPAEAAEKAETKKAAKSKKAAPAPSEPTGTEGFTEKVEEVHQTAPVPAEQLNADGSPKA